MLPSRVPAAFANGTFGGYVVTTPTCCARAYRSERHDPEVSRKECGPGAADCSPGRINAVSVARNVVLGCRLVASNSVPAARLMQSRTPSIAVLYSYGHVDDAPAAHRLRPWTTRRCAAALPTAAAFDHMPTDFHH